MTLVFDTPAFKVLQYKTGCLAQYAYIIDSNKEIVVIDPLRDGQTYLDYAAQNGGTIKYIFETHYHADFVSGHVDLMKNTKATVVFGPDSQPDFPAHVAKDGEEITVGNVKIRILHTPGHTLESSCYVLLHEGKELAVFTGDTLFLGDVGRPDLAQKGLSLTDKDLATMLFHSLKKLKALPEECTVLPGHGAGSACGKKISAGDKCDIGRQAKNNLAFSLTDEKTFVELATADLPAPPSYFALNVALNKSAEVKLFLTLDYSSK